MILYSEKWESLGVIGENRNVNIEEIRQIESILNIKFPIMYEDIAKYANPAYIEIGCFNYNVDGETCISDFLPLSLFRDHGSVLWYVLDNQEFPEDFFPFARDSGDILICFDYRKSKSEPKIVLFDPLSAEVYNVADDFENFLGILHE